MTESVKKVKSKLNTDPLALTDKSYMYYLKGQPWVPHYTDKGVFVAPGGFEKRESELAVLGAVKKEAFLWPRYWMNEKSRLVK
jgi:hypothetical protein